MLPDINFFHLTLPVVLLFVGDWMTPTPSHRAHPLHRGERGITVYLYPESILLLLRYLIWSSFQYVVLTYILVTYFSKHACLAWNQLSSSYPTSYIAAAWLDDAHPFPGPTHSTGGRGDDGLWPWPWQGGWGGDPEPGAYIYIYIIIDISESDFFIYNPVIQAHRKFLRPKSGRLGRIVREKATAAPSYQPSYHGFSIVTCVFLWFLALSCEFFFVWGYKYILTLTTRMISIPRKIDCTYTPVICALGALWHCVWRFRWLLRPWNDHTDHQRRPCRVWKPCQWRGCHPQQVWNDWSCGRGIEVHLGDLNAKMFSPTK